MAFPWLTNWVDPNYLLNWEDPPSKVLSDVGHSSPVASPQFSQKDPRFRFGFDPFWENIILPLGTGSKEIMIKVI